MESGTTSTNYATILNTNSSIIHNFGVLFNFGVFNNTNTGTINNSGTIENDCAGIIIGSITGNPPVDTCNDQPVALDQSVTTDINTSVSITLVATDPDGNSLTFSIVSPPSHGVVFGTGPNLVYTPAANYEGSDIFTFKASDGKLDSNVAIVSIIVEAGNNAPIANNDEATTDENTPIVIDILANDIDPDGEILSLSVSTIPANGTVTINPDSTVTYSPNVGFSGTDSFTYVISDGSGGTSTAIVTIEVLPTSSPSDMINELKETIDDMNLPPKIMKNLNARLDASLASLEKGQDNSAKNHLNTFINYVEAQTGKSITEEQALLLIESASNIRDSI